MTAALQETRRKNSLPVIVRLLNVLSVTRAMRYKCIILYCSKNNNIILHAAKKFFIQTKSIKLFTSLSQSAIIIHACVSFSFKKAHYIKLMVYVHNEVTVASNCKASLTIDF